MAIFGVPSICPHMEPDPSSTMIARSCAATDRRMRKSFVDRFQNRQAATHHALGVGQVVRLDTFGADLRLGFYIAIVDPTSGTRVQIPPTGHVMGIYARSDTAYTTSDLVRATLSQDRPVLPAPHQVAQEINKTVFQTRVTSKRSLVFHAKVTLSSTLLGVLSQRLITVGMGELRPVADNSTINGR